VTDSCHLLQAKILQDLQVLSDAARETVEVDANQDPLEIARTYGTIINKTVRRRTGRRPSPPISSTAASVPAEASSLSSKPAGIKEVKSLSTLNVKSEVKPSQYSGDIPRKGSQEKRNTSANPPQLKRDSSNIFKSFAKTKPPLKREGTDSSVGASGLDSAPPSGLEDEAMKDTSEGEEDDYIPPPQASSKGPTNSDRNSRKEREAALKKMMEDEEDENDEADVILENQHAESPKDSPATQPEEEAVQVSGGRRRGRRRVMKKKTIKDEEGYLGALEKLFRIPLIFHDVTLIYCIAVTREEPAWESFSEDEPVKTKPKAPSSLPTSSDKSKKGSGKAGQGSIMSFFGKK
jgi:DNA polymerase delta subunit 3